MTITTCALPHASRRIAGKFECAVHACCLMTNHMHLLLTSRRADGSTLLMKAALCSVCEPDMRVPLLMRWLRTRANVVCPLFFRWGLLSASRDCRKSILVEPIRRR